MKKILISLMMVAGSATYGAALSSSDMYQLTQAWNSMAQTFNGVKLTDPKNLSSDGPLNEGGWLFNRFYNVQLTAAYQQVTSATAVSGQVQNLRNAFSAVWNMFRDIPNAAKYWKQAQAYWDAANK